MGRTWDDDLGEAGFLPRFLALAKADPKRVFARFEGEPLTFGRLRDGAGAVAHYLRDRGLRKGDRVALMARNSPRVLALLYGIAESGAVWVPVNVQLQHDGLRYILEHCDPSLVIAEQELVSRVQDSGARLPGPVVEADQLHVWSRPHPPLQDVVPAADDIFAIMYTSGTTGPPKGAIVSHRMLYLAGKAASLASTARDGDVFFVWEPLYHIGGAQLLILPLLHQIVLAMVPRFSATEFWEQVRANGCTHIHFLGGILQILLKQPPQPLDRSHRARIAWGGGCPVQVWRRFEQRFAVQIRECYGMTEAASITTFNDDGVPGTVGRPVPWFSVQLLDAQGHPVAPGERGEIVVRTSVPGALFPGYFRNPDATARALRNGALFTGDVGSFDPAGNMIFHGRLSDSVRCRGENVSAWEVEHVVADHPAVEGSAMIGVAAEVGEQEIKLFVKPKQGHAIDPAALSTWLEERLAPYQLPRYIEVVAEFEWTPSLRIMKHRLPRTHENSWDRLAAGASAGPGGPT